jgi:calcium-dependent protein kinase
LLSAFDDGRAGGLHKLLGAMDANHSGALDRHELRRGLHTLGMDLPVDGIDALLAAFDRSGDGLIDFNEFYSTLVDFRKVANTVDEAMRRLALALGGEGRGAMSELLLVLDVNGDGRLSRSELRNGLEALGMRIRGEALDMLMAKLDHDGNGLIDSDEFCTTLESVKSAHGLKFIERPTSERSAEIEEISALLEDIAQASDVGGADLSSL